jgi:hypothetical protein
MKKKRHIVLAVIAVLIAGCDEWFTRRMNVSEEGPGRLEVASVSEALALAVVRQYAAANDIPCDDSGKLPIECRRQPIHIWAMRAAKNVVVCYSAMGIPLESGKFRRRMDRLQAMLQERFGKAAVSVSSERCPSPPSFNEPRRP